MTEKFKALCEQIAALEKEKCRLLPEAFDKGSRDIFTKYPNLFSFSWRQYTPYFNDGDACYFRACTDDIDVITDDEDESEKISDDISEFLSLFDNDSLQYLFDDHVIVTVTRDAGVEKRDYTHHD